MIDGDQYSPEGLCFRIADVAAELGNKRFAAEIRERLDAEAGEPTHDDDYAEAIYEASDSAAEWLSSIAPEGYWFGANEQHAWGFWQVEPEFEPMPDQLRDLHEVADLYED